MSTQASHSNQTLYQRLGGEMKLKIIVDDVLDKNASNPMIAYYFEKIDMDRLKLLVFEFFSMCIGGPHSYSGRDMRTAHTGLNITDEEWDSGTEDTIWALDKNGVDPSTRDEVIAILETMRGDIVGV
ncbi:group 1 truncated hemoglobin [Algoriphagus halophilus]|uniref:group I truncated hemoglobin n=1 Tax=Algoriphagus halophilus TaxID=226505 RepID=UPI00358ED662